MDPQEVRLEDLVLFRDAIESALADGEQEFGPWGGTRGFLKNHEGNGHTSEYKALVRLNELIQGDDHG